jgi:hypothetical protein
MTSIGYYDGFSLGKYATVNDIKPTKRAYAFWKQMKALLYEKDILNFKYNKSFKSYGSIGLGDIDHELDYPELKDCNDCKGDSFIQGIISQRKERVIKLSHQMWDQHDMETREERQKQERIEQNYEWAMEATRRREEELEEVEFQRRKLIDEANAELRANRYVYLKKKAAIKRREAEMDAGLKALKSK